MIFLTDTYTRVQHEPVIFRNLNIMYNLNTIMDIMYIFSKYGWIIHSHWFSYQI